MGLKGRAESQVTCDAELAPVPSPGASSVELLQARDTTAYVVPKSAWAALGAMLRAVCATVPAQRGYCLLQLPHWRFPTGCLVRGEQELAFRLGASLADAVRCTDS